MKDEISLAGDSRLEEVGRLCHSDLIGCRRQPSEVYLCGRQHMSKCIPCVGDEELASKCVVKRRGRPEQWPCLVQDPREEVDFASRTSVCNEVQRAGTNEGKMLESLMSKWRYDSGNSWLE